MHNVQCILEIPYCILNIGYKTEHCTLRTVQWTLHTAIFTEHAKHCTLHTANYTLHTAHSTLNTVHCTLQTTNYTLHTTHCTLHTAHCIKLTAHCQLHTLKTAYSKQLYAAKRPSALWTILDSFDTWPGGWGSGGDKVQKGPSTFSHTVQLSTVPVRMYSLLEEWWSSSRTRWLMVLYIVTRTRLNLVYRSSHWLYYEENHFGPFLTVWPILTHFDSF